MREVVIVTFSSVIYARTLLICAPVTAVLPSIQIQSRVLDDRSAHALAPALSTA
jgi:hypothetical protein